MTIPTHIPADRVFDFNIYDFEVDGAEYQAGMQRLLQSDVPEIFWTPHNGGHWVVTRSEQINEVLNDHEHFSSRQIAVPKAPVEQPPLKPLQVDPPQHLKYRNLLATALSPKAVANLAENVRTLAIELIDGFKPRGECEFISEFAQHLPIAIFMNIVDLPEQDRSLLTGLAEIVVREDDEQLRGEALMKIAGYGMQKIIERRANPGSDLLSSIATAKVDGELLSEHDLTGMLTLLLLAGLDTVASMMGFFARFFALNPAHRRQLIQDPNLINNAVEELLRRYPIANLAREVTQDFEYRGLSLKAGDMIVAPTPLDGLDERRFEDPLSVNFNRDKPIHATFGGGVHRCMGSMLARTELRLFIEEWLKRIPEFEIKPGVEVKVAARTVATITSLPLVWDPASTH